MDTLLVVEDDKIMRQMLRETLEQHDFLILEAAHGKRLMEIISEHNVDLILMDMGLPDGSGIDFMPRIRKCTNAPVIIVSGDRGKVETLNGFKAGADDYIDKPFDPEILVARVRATLRRYKGSEANQNEHNGQSEKNEKIKFDQWIFDRARFQIFNAKGQPGDLTVCEFQLLDTLITGAGRALKREELCEAVREERYVPTPRAIDVKITRIRKKIGDNPHDPQIIKTVRGVGYMVETEIVSHL